MKRRSTDASDGAVLHALTIAAAMRRPCPSDDELAIAMNARNPASGAAALRRLEERGLITVEWPHGQRVVRIVESGLRTADLRGPALCPACGLAYCAHSDLEFAGIVPACTGSAVA